jgi:hypothetical protein
MPWLETKAQNRKQSEMTTTRMKFRVASAVAGLATLLSLAIAAPANAASGNDAALVSPSAQVYACSTVVEVSDPAGIPLLSILSSVGATLDPGLTLLGTGCTPFIPGSSAVTPPIQCDDVVFNGFIVANCVRSTP